MNYQNEATISALELELADILRSCEGVMDLIHPASLMLTMELAVLGRPMKAITLGELSTALERVADYLRGSNHN